MNVLDSILECINESTRQYYTLLASDVQATVVHDSGIGVFFFFAKSWRCF